MPTHKYIVDDIPVIHLIVLARQGDENSWNTLLCSDNIFHPQSLYKSMLQRAMYKLRSEVDAEDIVIETIIAMYEGIHALKTHENFLRWAGGILNNKINTKLKDYSKEVAYSKLKQFLLENKEEICLNNNENFNKIIETLNRNKTDGLQIDGETMKSLLTSLAKGVQNPDMKSKLATWRLAIDKKMYRIVNGSTLSAPEEDEDFTENEISDDGYLTYAGPDEALSFKQSLEMIDSFIQTKLTPVEREIFMLKLNDDDIKQTVIAKTLNLTNERVSVHWKQIKSKLRTHLGTSN